MPDDSNRSLSALRKNIDEINMGILDLINKRIDILEQIIQLKDKRSMEYFDPSRESNMMQKILQNNHGPLQDTLIKDIFLAIFLTSLEYMDIQKESKMLISSKSDKHFYSLQEIFDLPNDLPIIIAGPCAVESLECLSEVADYLSKKGIRFIRAGAYKPRTSPYDFQGLGKEGLKILHTVAKQYDLFSVTEAVDTRDVEIISQYVDILQIGARNMQNFELLKEVGKSQCTVLLKRGLSATINEFMFAAEYIASNGCNKIVLCERGIRTYETKTRNTLDISSIPIIKNETNLQIVADLSHSLGRKDIINPIAKAALAAGADGIMMEVHPKPELALSDSKQQLDFNEFEELLNALQVESIIRN